MLSIRDTHNIYKCNDFPLAGYGAVKSKILPSNLAFNTLFTNNNAYLACVQRPII